MKYALYLLLILCFPLSATAQFGHWEQLFPKNHPAYIVDHCMASIGKKKIILFGGDPRGPAYSDSTWLFDLEQNDWQYIDCKTKPPGREDAAIVQVSENRVVMCGGHEYFNPFGDIWLFDLDSLNWFELHPDSALTPRYSHNMAVVNDSEVVIYGGDVGDWIFSGQTTILNIKENTCIDIITQNYIGGRSDAFMTNLFNNIVIMFGGDEWFNYRRMEDTYLLKKDIETNKWKWIELTDLKKNFLGCTSGANAKIRDGVVLYQGGNCNNIPSHGDWYDGTWLFNYFENTWKQLDLSVSPGVRNWHRMAKIDENKILLYGYGEDTWLFVVDTVLEVENEFLKENELNIIQNESNLEILINISEPSNVQLDLYNLQGNKVYEAYLGYIEGSINKTIPINQLSAGVYIVIVKTGKNIISKKIIITNQ